MAIKIKLTHSELKALFEVTREIPVRERGMASAACTETIFRFIQKLQKQIFVARTYHTISFNYTEAYFFYMEMCKLLNKLSVYEQSLITKIINIIHQKTI